MQFKVDFYAKGAVLGLTNLYRVYSLRVQGGVTKEQEEPQTWSREGS